MIKLENVNKYFGDLHVLKDVNLEVKEGEKLVIIGPSGSGKSTTVRCMNFLEEPTSGHVYIDGKELTHKNRTHLVRETTSMVFQQFNLFPHMTVLQNITFAPVKLGLMNQQDAEKKARELLSRIGLADKENAYPAQLSGGEQQMLAMGRALMSKPRIILMDEPSMGLSPLLVTEIFDIIKVISESGTTVLLVEQNAKKALSIADRAYVLETGNITLSGKASDLMNNESVQKAYLGE